jgi:hypothetical protein
MFHSFIIDYKDKFYKKDKMIFNQLSIIFLCFLLIQILFQIEIIEYTIILYINH